MRRRGESNIMIRLHNDYNRGACAKILEKLAETNAESYDGYGEDTWCEKAADLIRKKCKAPEAAVHFLTGATQANFIVHAAALSPIQSVICPDSGHVYAHEAGSIENTGHKLVPLPSADGTITAEQIRKAAAAYYEAGEPNYLCEPKLVYISFPTEWGTLYSEQDLKDIRKVCDEYGMYLFVDGARLGYGLGSAKNDVTLEKLAELTDAFYIGGTKCGALFGEALVITNSAAPAQIIFGSTRRISAFRTSSNATQITISPILMRRRASPPRNNPLTSSIWAISRSLKNSLGCPFTMVGT